MTLPEEDEIPTEDLEAAFLPKSISPEFQASARKKTFAPWHHPVKQIVRDLQWGVLTKRLVSQRPPGMQVLRYFTLPGADLLDVRVLADVCSDFKVQIEYFGFNSGWGPNAESSNEAGVESARAAWADAEAALRQAGKITPYAEVASDRLEDIAVQTSNARASLSRKPIFDVINIDACDHLAYRPAGRERNTFDALVALLQHQIKATAPWLLFVTTRAEPDLLGVPGVALMQAISRNITSAPEFVPALAGLIGCGEGAIFTHVVDTWKKTGEAFLKLYGLGVAKYLLQYFLQQPNCPANVELASIFAYRVHGDSPNMAALAFLITPDPVRAFLPNSGSLPTPASLEPKRACAAASRAGRLLNIDSTLETNRAMFKKAVNSTEALLGSANYDISAWREWVQTHPTRPMSLSGLTQAGNSSKGSQEACSSE